MRDLKLDSRGVVVSHPGSLRTDYLSFREDLKSKNIKSFLSLTFFSRTKYFAIIEISLQKRPW